MSDRDAERQKRLRDALRENLKRRKSQARGRIERPTGDEPDPPVDAPPDDRSDG